MTVDAAANVVGYDDYYPYGMVMRSSTSSSVDARYKFTMKERDAETTYDYFGARYYDSRIGRWLSVDPLASKYPGWSPYNYTLGNPLKFVDPDGRDVVVLVANGGAGGRGHMGAVIQDAKGNYYYMTVGNADPNATTSQLLTSGARGGMALVPLNTNDRETAVHLALQDKNNSKYSDGIILNTSSSMDKAIFESATNLQESINSGETKYNALTNNCADAVEKVIEDGTGVDFPTGLNPEPNKKFDNIKEKGTEVQNEINNKIKEEKKQF